jgi:hypothetical protein
MKNQRSRARGNRIGESRPQRAITALREHIEELVRHLLPHFRGPEMEHRLPIYLAESLLTEMQLVHGR